MKRFYLIAILFAIASLTAMAQDKPDMTHQTTGEDRDGIVSFKTILTPLYDEPYIEVLGCEDSYYDVTVTIGMKCMWNGIIGREYGTVINYEFSSTKSYVITVTSLQGASHYVWRLENGVLNGSSRLPNWEGITDQWLIGGNPFFDR